MWQRRAYTIHLTKQCCATACKRPTYHHESSGSHAAQAITPDLSHHRSCGSVAANASVVVLLQKFSRRARSRLSHNSNAQLLGSNRPKAAGLSDAPRRERASEKRRQRSNGENPLECPVGMGPSQGDRSAHPPCMRHRGAQPYIKAESDHSRENGRVTRGRQPSGSIADPDTHAGACCNAHIGNKSFPFLGGSPGRLLMIYSDLQKPFRHW